MKYVIVTSAGYWGKGETLTEAAKNANVRAGTEVRGMVIRFDERVHSDVTVDDMGGVVYHLTDAVVEDVPPPQKAAMRDLSNLGYFGLRLRKGELVMSVLPD